MRAFLLITSILLLNLGYAQEQSSFVAGEIIVKIKPNYGDKCQNSTIQIPEIE